MSVQAVSRTLPYRADLEASEVGGEAVQKLEAHHLLWDVFEEGKLRTESPFYPVAQGRRLRRLHAH